ncbi:RNA polymerase sigma factor, sigma-70 family [Caldanaerobius fijiensis DSM 17918]|uniref:RNA polymerase sigma factor, sigma-70 family n=1 Tax=Caldanaerobius fijiensis DSM 17918 TaxID=1121256 RepID=A0A1M5CMX3_9THEO|nr:RNA polymerase sigma factor SigX [Caldanaerobius fijiensis]SHF56016.1 RNA polymerase sigma factor, sigma-70 family [Caldanaerobius fijiensis DSM 17918]
MIKIQHENFKEIFEAYYHKVCRQVALTLGDDILAQDVAQEAFLKLYTNPPADTASIGGWLCKVAMNIAYNRIRTEKNLKSREQKALFQDLLFSPEDAAIDMMERKKAREILMKMDTKDMMCLVLKHSGYSYEEIASALGIKKSSVGTTIARAQRKFKKLFESEV